MVANPAIIHQLRFKSACIFCSNRPMKARSGTLSLDETALPCIEAILPHAGPIKEGTRLTVDDS